MKEIFKTPKSLFNFVFYNGVFLKLNKTKRLYFIIQKFYQTKRNQ